MVEEADTAATTGIIDSLRKSVMGFDPEASSASPFKPSPFVEVSIGDGTRRRFAAGTKAGFALERINGSDEGGGEMCGPLYSLIKAVKEGEDAVEFGPNADLVSYGDGWELQAVQDAKLLKSCGKSSEKASTSCTGGGKREAKHALKPISQPGRKIDFRNLWQCIGSPASPT